MRKIDTIQDPMPALDQLPVKVEKSLARLREFEPPEGYYLAFSGGKDSQCVYRLAEIAGVKFDTHYSVTNLDPPDLVRFIRGNYPEVIHEHPIKSFWQLLKYHGLPTRVVRWCCSELKEIGGKGRRVLTGVRWQESKKRANLGIVEQCGKIANKIIVNPIIEWSESDVWRFIRDQRLDYCNLYDEGQKRIGCMFCPYSSIKEKQFYLAKYPGYERLFLHWLRRRIALKEDADCTAMELWNWYLTHDGKLKKDEVTDGLFI